VSGEADRLIAALGVGPGSHVADVGAGGGALARALAERVGPTGRVYATELPGDTLGRLRSRVASVGPARIEVVEGSPDATNLSPGCCDAIVMRTVFHHLEAPERFGLSLREALRPAGRLAVIDFRPGSLWHLSARPAGADTRRTGHGITVDELVAALAPAGFRARVTVESWSGPLFLAVFEAPR
jgi:ubiquinone/menaquinone biosynthesis C-methylase UbiE